MRRLRWDPGRRRGDGVRERHRARPHAAGLDPSMERALRAETYVRAVSGITGDALRFARSDGFVPGRRRAVVAPSRPLAGDTASYRRLRRFVEIGMIERDSSGVQPRRRVRAGAPTERATPYAVGRLGDALAIGWQSLGDTASAVLAASLRAGESPEPAGSATDQLVERCVTALASVSTDAAKGRRLCPVPGSSVAASRPDRRAPRTCGGAMGTSGGARLPHAPGAGREGSGRDGAVPRPDARPARAPPGEERSPRPRGCRRGAAGAARGPGGGTSTIR